MYGVTRESEQKTVWSAQKGGQEKFLACPIFECLFESNRGSGKTDALLMDFAKNVGRGWGASWSGILFRDTFENLKDVIKKANKWFRQIFPTATYNQSSKCWTFGGGEKLYFAYARTVDDYWNYHGSEYPWVGWEELTTWATPDLYMMMMSVCRCSDKRVDVRCYRATCNPWGKGHSWVKERFIDSGKAGKIIRDVMTIDMQKEAGIINATEDKVIERCYVHGDRIQNKILLKADPDYELNLARNKNEATRQAWIAGSWDICSGGMFDDVYKKEVHAIEPFIIPRSWKVYRAFDWGMSKPFSIGWWAVCDGSVIKNNKGEKVYYPRNTLIRVGEWYGWERGHANVGLRITNTQIGREMLIRENALKRMYDIPKIYAGPADASIFGQTDDGDSIAMKISRAFYHNQKTKYTIFTPSNKKPGTRVMRWQLMRDRLKAGLDKDIESPQMYCFNTCTQGFMRTIIGIARDDKNPDDLDTDAEDHCMDETAYMVLDVSKGGTIANYKLGRH